MYRSHLVQQRLLRVRGDVDGPSGLDLPPRGGFPEAQAYPHGVAREEMSLWGGRGVCDVPTRTYPLKGTFGENDTDLRKNIDDIEMRKFASMQVRR